MDDNTVPIDPDGIYAGPSDDEYKYRLIASLGSGGEGTVWRAEVRPELGLPQVAVKVDREQGGEQAAFASRAREWAGQRELLLHLSHPAVVRIRDAFIAAAPHRPGEPKPGRASYLVMKLVEGESLAIWAAKGPVTLGDALAKLTAAGVGVSYLHSGTDTGRPIIHRDLKPANIMVQSDGGVVIVDFGLARGAGLPPRGGGTPGYQAPEVARGEYDIASDIFAFAGVAYYLFVGDNPPENNDLSVMRKRLSARESLRHQPRLVEHLLLGRDPDPGKRPSDVSAWLSGFGTSLTTRTVVDSHYPPPPPEPLPPTPADQDPPPKPRPTPVSQRPRLGRWLLPLLLILALGAAGLYRASPWTNRSGSGAAAGPTTTTLPATTTTRQSTTSSSITLSSNTQPTTATTAAPETFPVQSRCPDIDVASTAAGVSLIKIAEPCGFRYQGAGGNVTCRSSWICTLSFSGQPVLALQEGGGQTFAGVTAATFRFRPAYPSSAVNDLCALARKEATYSGRATAVTDKASNKITC